MFHNRVILYYVFKNIIFAKIIIFIISSKNMSTILNLIKTKAESIFNINVENIIQLKQSGSYRQYFRLYFENRTILGVYNADMRENDAFISFSKHFLSKGLNVPKVLASFTDENIYFIEDLGDTTLFNFIQQCNSEDEKIEIYKKVIDNLIEFQNKAIEGLDLSKAFPKAEFDHQSIMWDLNYFKYMVLKIAKVPFEEQKLEDDFAKLSSMLTSADSSFFLYRDFQSQNIMLHDNKLYFIDYQGGRKGAIYYDLASLLYDSKAKLSQENRQILLDYYFNKFTQDKIIDYKVFESNFYNFVLIRILQASAAYCFRGLVEKKLSFIASLPFSIQNIKFLLDNNYISEHLTELKRCLEFYVYKSEVSQIFNKRKHVKVRINSFSFLKGGYPKDEKNNGGGFVFDCRFLPNPGAYEQYKHFNGLDNIIKDYLCGFVEVENFIVKCTEIVLNAIDSYEIKQYEHLQVNFGCTGGKHRSVYCAQKTFEILKNIFNINVDIKHIELEKINSQTL